MRAAEGEDRDRDRDRDGNEREEGPEREVPKRGQTKQERLAELHARAMELPLRPGVYLMKDAGEAIIYVGKSKALRNRVSQYFEETASHSVKTKKMVATVRSFSYILCDTRDRGAGAGKQADQAPPSEV